ncbi:OmpA family protein [Parvularcula sp. LCG005]|uniref:OmpA family protein n=1 Tax=Parvularcula sp. LCG005 TaxID=3078805 RepID=UPI0029429488|nr:OmpA family protein [Parvularcula sp. LCG005]WOI53592.1 OmpA family protein [Parvularcula sp. LCG005]
MMKTKLALLAAAGSLALFSAANAQDSGYYGALNAGVVFDSDGHDVEPVAGAYPAIFDTEFELDSNITVSGALGRYFENGFRGEVELATRTQEIKGMPGDGLGFAGFPGVSGDLSATTLMMNLYKDFSIDAAGRITPYVGVGVGAARMRPEFDNIATGVIAADVSDMAASNMIVVGDMEYTPAIQGLAGLTFDFTENMLFSVGYKYLLADQFEYGSYVNGPAANLSSGYDAHELTVGLRWNWGVEEPVIVEEAPQPVQMQTCFDGSRIPVTQECPPEIEEEEMMTELDPLVVYFDYDKSVLTDAARTLIAARAEEALEGDVSSISVSGNTDTSGSASYNQALSARRAAVVRDALVANGISSSVITVEALGESNPAKPTADGVKEPLNRRTEVEFSF